MRIRRAIGAGACCLVLAACGSEVPPGQFIGDGGYRTGGPQGNGTGQPGGTDIAEPLGSGQPTNANNSGAPGATGAPGGNNPGSSATPGGNQPAVPGIKAGSCAGFTNGHGITSSTIKLANASDVSGPIPGLFTSAQQAAKAYLAYFNATSSVCGRKLSMTNYDSRTSTIGDQDAATSACGSSFAMVGSMGAFDSGGAKTVTDCGIPDLRAITTTPERFASPNTFGTDAINPQQVSTAQYRYLKSLTGDAYKKAALVYLDAGAAVPNAKADQKTAESIGFHFVSVQAIDVTAFNYTPFASNMVKQGVKFVQYVGAWQYAIRLRQAMNEQGVKAAFMMDSVAYDPAFVTSGSSTINNTYAFVNTALFEEVSRSAELQLYLKWLKQVAPNARPSFFGEYAWGAMKLFTELAVQLGGKLNRQTLLAAIRATHGYTANGLFTAQDVGGKHTPNCQTIIQLQKGKWIRKSPYPYTCSSVYNTR